MVICTILHGFSEWRQPTRIPTRSHTLTVGSLHGSDMVLTAAYDEQFHSLCWFQLCLGRISKKWSRVVSLYVKQENGPKVDEINWSPMIITIL